MPLASLAGSSQKELSRKLDTLDSEDLRESVSRVEDRARLSSLSLKHSGDWLNVVPCPALGFHMRGVEFRMAALYSRFGMPVFATEGRCIACNQESDVYDNHAISCGVRGSA